MKKLHTIIALLFCTWLAAFLSACNLGEVDLNAPNLNATYVGDQESVYRAILDGVMTYYSANTYICTDGFIYHVSNVGVPLTNMDGSDVMCEVTPVSRITIVNDNSPYIQ